MSFPNLSMYLTLLSLLGLVCCWLFYDQEKYFGKTRKGLHAVVCGQSSCAILSKSPYHHLLGIPNWWLGIAFYLLLLAYVIHPATALLIASTIAAILALIFSFILIWALLFKLRFFCRVCYCAHAINTIILVLLVIELVKSNLF